MGQDFSGITTSVGVKVNSYASGGSNAEHIISIEVFSIYSDNEISPGDTITVAGILLEKVAWDPDGDGPQSAYGSSISIANTMIRFKDGSHSDSASDVLTYPGGVSSLGAIGLDVVFTVATAAASAGIGLALNLAYIGAMAAMDAVLTPNFVSDFGDGSSASVEWDKGIPSATYPTAYTYNKVELGLGNQDMSYAFKITPIFGGIGHKGPPRIVMRSFPVPYISVWPHNLLSHLC